ncbi:MAG: hypothetical protein ACK5XN_40180, partial [Bacteroidota bacterium]
MNLVIRHRCSEKKINTSYTLNNKKPYVPQLTSKSNGEKKSQIANNHNSFYQKQYIRKCSDDCNPYKTSSINQTNLTFPNNSFPGENHIKTTTNLFNQPENDKKRPNLFNQPENDEKRPNLSNQKSSSSSNKPGSSSSDENSSKNSLEQTVNDFIKYMLDNFKTTVTDTRKNHTISLSFLTIPEDIIKIFEEIKFGFVSIEKKPEQTSGMLFS